MRVPAFFLLFTLCGFPILAHGGTLREIELTDGSVIRAEVVSMNGQTYHLRSETLGEVEIPESRVRAIRAVETPTTPQQSSAVTSANDPRPALAPSAPPSASAVDDLQQAFSQNPATLNEILSLQDDPLMQSILRDERTMQAVQSGDLGTLLSDPKIRALMNHPTIQGLTGKYGH